MVESGNGRRVGFVGLDTSHPAHFLPILRELGFEITAIQDRGDIRGPGYAAEFARQHEVPLVCERPEDLCEAVDIAVVGGANWDRRADAAAPLVAAGKGVLLDKPLAGRLGDLRRYREWTAAGARIGGGSALRWGVETQAWRAGRRVARYALTGCAGHPLDYGVHGYALALSLLGSGVGAVRWLGGDPLHRVELRWPNGTGAEVALDRRPGRLPFFATVFTDDAVEHVVPRFDQLYPALLGMMMPYLAGEAPAPLTIGELVEPEVLAIAALASEQDSGRWIALGDPVVERVSYDGAAFAASYRPHDTGHPSGRR